MRRKIMSGVMATFLLMPFSALAQTTEQPEWCNEYVSGVNKEEAVRLLFLLPMNNKPMNLDY